MNTNQDPKTEAVRAFLSSMEVVRNEIHDFYLVLCRRPEVKSADPWYPRASLYPDLGVSLELKNGARVDFWIETESPNEDWIVASSVLRGEPDEDGTHTEIEFPVQRVSSADQLSCVLLAVIRNLRKVSLQDAIFR